MPTPPRSAFGLDTPGVEDPADFDLDAAIAGAKRPTRVVRLVMRPDLVHRLEEIAEQVALARPSEDPERGMDEDSADSLLEEFRALRQEMTDTTLRVTVRGLTNEEMRAARDAAAKASGGKPTDTASAHHNAAAAVVSPPMTAAQVAALGEAIGDGEMGKLYSAMLAAREGVSVPSIPTLPPSSNNPTPPR